MGDVARDLAYRLFTACERANRASDARGYNSLVVAWPAITARLCKRPQIPSACGSHAQIDD
jgi:putative DNA methylase